LPSENGGGLIVASCESGCACWNEPTFVRGRTESRGRRTKTRPPTSRDRAVGHDRRNYRTEENIWIRELGPGIVADAFRWAHRADPRAKLFFNDYGVEDPNPKSDAYYELVQEMLADDVPVDGFSVQGHLSMQYGAPARLEENLQRFADLGLETAVTEIDVRMVVEGDEPTNDQLQQQADYYRQMLGDCLDVEGQLAKKPSYHALLFRLAGARYSR
jgi:hypothetical protein